MKTRIGTSLIALFVWVPATHAEFSSDLLHTDSITRMIVELNFFKSFGNRVRMVDYENMLVKFRHGYKDGARIYKIYKVDVEKPSKHVIALDYTIQSEQGIDEHGWWDDENIPDIDLDKALEQWTEFRIPKGHPLYVESEIGMNRRIRELSIDRPTNDEGDQQTNSEKDTPVRFLVSFSGKVKRIDVFSVAKTKEGVRLTVEILVPSEQTSFWSLNSQMQKELVEQLLKNISTVSPDSSDERDSADQENSNGNP